LRISDAVCETAPFAKPRTKIVHQGEEQSTLTNATAYL